MMNTCNLLTRRILAWYGQHVHLLQATLKNHACSQSDIFLGITYAQTPDGETPVNEGDL